MSFSAVTSLHPPFVRISALSRILPSTFTVNPIVLARNLLPIARYLGATLEERGHKSPRGLARVLGMSTMAVRVA